ncbi:MAG: class I SAM-dependent methyltransferase [Bdellovibrionota bacterium]|jgi:2-polyprenyl-3-methyl-5-hydroxy-6-metoxy-1,4-benzoquinol methylase
MTTVNTDLKEWAIKLFQKSPLKQNKYRMITALLPNLSSAKCLDVGSDNGVISMLLRERGGEWCSADLLPETVQSIRSLVESNVYQIADGEKLPFSDANFDGVVVVDMLEHLQNDRFFVEEIYRILKPAGWVIFNVPNPKEGLLRKFQYLIGQTDAAHGHLRVGYTSAQLQCLISKKFEVEKQLSYSGFFSVLIDTILTFALSCLKKGGRGEKGTIVTGDDLDKMQKSFKLYTLIYPVVACFVKLDNVFLRSHRNMLISLCKKCD